MKNKKFDQGLKSELEHYQSSADPNAIWAAIESEVEQINEEVEQKNRRPFVWIFSLLFIGLVTGTLLIGKWKTATTEPSVTNLVNQTTHTDLPNISISNLAENKTSTSKATAFSTEKIETPKNINLEKNIKASKKINTPITLVKNKPTTESLDVDLSQNLVIKKLNNNSPKKVDDGHSDFVKPSKATVVLIDQIFSTEIKSNANITSKSLQTLSDKIILLDLPFADLSQITPPEIVEILSLAERRRRRTPAWNLGLEIQGGAAFTNRTLSLNNSENQTYLNRRAATESVLETVQLGASVEFQHRSGFSIRTGMQWSRIAEKYQIEETTTVANIENTLVSYSLNMNQDTVNRTYDDIVRTSTITTTREGFNRYRLLDIPLLLGYHLKNENWSVGLETGILTNLSLSTKGYIYDENNELIDLATSQASFYKSSVGIGFYVGVTGRVALTDNTQITISPFYRKNAGSFTLSEGLLAQKYGWLGLNLGMRYGF